MKLQNTLLRLYPREWRARYEAEFTALLEQQSFSLVDIADVALGALDAHLRPQVAAEQVKSERGPFVNRTSFTKWSGVAGMAGSVLFLLGLVAASILNDGESLYLYDGFDVAARAIFLAGVALTLIFLGGFALACAWQIGALGQAGLLLALVSMLSTGVGSVGHLTEAIRGFEVYSWWGYFILGIAGTLTGGALFCLAGSGRQALPLLASRLAMLGGFGGVATLLLSMGIIPGTNFDNMQAILLTLMTVALLAFQGGIFLLGYALWGRQSSVARQVEPAALA